MSQAPPSLLRRGAQRGPLWVEVSGDSMGRTIAGGSRVMVTSADRPRRGQVWAFRSRSGRLVVHRYLGRRGDQMWFRGDANPFPDLPVTSAELVGRVRAVHDGHTERSFGRLQTIIGRVRLDVRSAQRRLQSRKMPTGR